MPTTPTPGAFRAAKRIIVDRWNNQSEYILHTARIIDEETHAGELLAALKALLETTLEWDENVAVMNQAESAITKAEGNNAQNNPVHL